MEPTDRSFETKSDIPDFQTQIGAILNRSLTPEVIASYADDALVDLVAVIEEALAQYAVGAEDIPKSDVEAERAALEYFNINPDAIEESLDRIADLDQEIKSVMSFAHQYSGSGNTVIVPTNDALQRPITPGDEAFGERKTILRLETILLLLKNRYDIVPKNADEANKDDDRFLPGAVAPTMIRQTAYDLIDSPTLNRFILVCNEEGNRTFVLNREKALDMGRTAEVISAMDKDELRDLIEQNALIGKSFIYSENSFTKTVIHLLEDIDEPEQDQDNISDKLMLPFADKNLVKTVNGIRATLADMYGCLLDNSTVRRAITELSEEGLIHGQMYRFGPKRVTRAYTDADFELVREKLYAEGLLYPKATPDEINFPSEVARMLSISQLAVATLAERAGIDVEELPYRRFVSTTARACVQEDVDAISAYIAAHPLEIRVKQGKIDFRFASNQEILDQAEKLSPGKPMSGVDMDRFSEQGLFPLSNTISKRFESIANFNKLRGFEHLRQRGLSDEDIFALANRYSPGQPMTRDEVAALSKQAMFVSNGTIANRFGSLTEFNRRRGFDMSKITDLSNQELLALADELCPGQIMTQELIRKFSSEGKFISEKTVISRFGGITPFNEARKLK